MLLTILLKMLNEQALWETCRTDFCLLLPCSEQAPQTLTLQCIGFLHTRDDSFSHQSPAEGYSSSMCVCCSPAPSSDV